MLATKMMTNQLFKRLLTSQLNYNILTTPPSRRYERLVAADTNIFRRNNTSLPILASFLLLLLLSLVKNHCLPCPAAVQHLYLRKDNKSHIS